MSADRQRIDEFWEAVNEWRNAAELDGVVSSREGCREAGKALRAAVEKVERLASLRASQESGPTPCKFAPDGQHDWTNEDRNGQRVNVPLCAYCGRARGASPSGRPPEEA